MQTSSNKNCNMINIYELFNTKSSAAASNNANSLLQSANGPLFYNKE